MLRALNCYIIISVSQLMKNDHLIRFRSKSFVWFYQLWYKWKSRQATFCLIRKYQWICSISYTIVLLREDENSFAVELLIVFFSSPPYNFSLFSQTGSSFPFSFSLLSLSSNIGLVLVDSYKTHSLIERNHRVCRSIINFYLVLHFNISSSRRKLNANSSRQRSTLRTGTVNY
jgi:hypothetical protein